MKLNEAKQILKENGYILEQNGEGKSTWSPDTYRPFIDKFAEEGAEAANEWLDSVSSDTDATELGEYVAEYVMNHKEEILNEFKNKNEILRECGKYIMYHILKSWYTGDNDDVEDLENSIIDNIN